MPGIIPVNSLKLRKNCACSSCINAWSVSHGFIRIINCCHGHDFCLRTYNSHCSLPKQQLKTDSVICRKAGGGWCMLSFSTHRWRTQHLWLLLAFDCEGDNSALKISTPSRHLQGLLQLCFLHRIGFETEIEIRAEK